MQSNAGPHAGARILRRGLPLSEASHAVILLHGRGASAEDILGLGDALVAGVPDQQFALLAPQAEQHTWYPYSFLAPRVQNEPWLSSALQLVNRLIEECAAGGITSSRVVLCGFSQGACLASESVASHARRYGALLAFTGGLIGPPGADLSHPGNLDGTPVLLSSGDPDPHVPWARVEETATVLREMGAGVQTLRHPGRPHTILPAEVRAAQDLLRSTLAS